MVHRDLKAWAGEPGTVLLDRGKTRGVSPWSGRFVSPTETLVAWNPDEVKPLLETAQRWAESGKTLAGYLAYEAASAFGLCTHAPQAGFPLAWFGVYDRARRLTRSDWPEEPRLVGSLPLETDSFNYSESAYCSAVEAVRAWIAEGHTYQVNLTGKRRFTTPGTPFDFYTLLRRLQPVPYSAYLNLGGFQILSCSPELFLHCDGETLTTRPMKGTRPRGLDEREDARLRRTLRQDPKERAENVMIVDLMRNDLGRVCETGSIRVPRLFDVERYASVHQMTSTVTGRLRPEVGLVEILEAAFPCGSITGAPKRRTMEIICDLEPEARGVYCGLIGRIGPGRRLTFNVAIRTLLHAGGGEYELGVGSGITWSSEPKAEWRETLLKSHFVQSRLPDFSLIETLLCRPLIHLAASSEPVSPANASRYLYCEDHLNRLASSARYWGFPFSRRRIETALCEAAAESPDRPFVLRLALDRQGTIRLTPRPVEPVAGPVRVGVSERRTRSRDPFLCHKTDVRELYDAEFRNARLAGFFDVLFTNEDGLLTEGAISNVFVCLAGVWHTPPLERRDVLPGVWRRHFVTETSARETALRLDDLRRADRIVVGNSVRGAIEVEAVVTREGVLWTRTEASDRVVKTYDTSR